ncbi:hypothetical protein [Asticcacaulis excentricus]|uniref:Uncharacterized protein n=1 Tax=Asticcacaulis excentricus (strain ATCC 15261 / DSM 4724 / KCTC 12464 / NCIMB 9791 / VKM B-1370 / CB 48) TaxID=573065 RepID=E8RL16_ASTEC|nr:hypothetical protein [Asticcacaulis excentricus]ADU13629.1 hypothetical protein Astex_1966 [Asticcacaulis excentricus CB 48]
MSFAQSILMPKKILIAGWVMIITLWVAIAVERFTDVETLPFVRTVFIYLVLDYMWSTFYRQWRGGKA